MRTAASLHLSPFQAAGKTLSLLLRFVILMVVYFALFAIGGQIVGPYLPNNPAEPGPVPQMTGLLIACATSVAVIMMMIASSRWHGWKLMTEALGDKVQRVDAKVSKETNARQAGDYEQALQSSQAALSKTMDAESGSGNCELALAR